MWIGVIRLIRTRTLTVRLLDPFGVELGNGAVTITDEAWYRDLPADVQRAQVKAITSRKYAQSPYAPDAGQGPPFQLELS